MIYIAGYPNCQTREMSVADKVAEELEELLGMTVDFGFRFQIEEDRREYMHEAFSRIAEAASVVFLPDWKRHRETQVQHLYCKYIGKRVLYYKITAAGAQLVWSKEKKRRKRKWKTSKKKS